MRSLYIIALIYIGLYFYGASFQENTPEPTEANQKIILKDNKIPLYNAASSKVASFECQSLETDNQIFQAQLIKLHIYAPEKGKPQKDLVLNKKVELPPEDLFLDADFGSFSRHSDDITLKGNIKITLGANTLLLSDECIYKKNESSLFFPNLFSLQRETHFISGKRVIYQDIQKTFHIEKDIVTFFEMPEAKNRSYIAKDQKKLTKLTSVGPLQYNTKDRIIILYHFTKLENQQMHLTADSVKIFLDNENKVEALHAEGHTQIFLKEKNIHATSPKAVLNFKEHIFNFMSMGQETPYFDMNGYRQSASYIVYDENTGIMKAGPEVKSIKIPTDAQE